VIGGPLAPATSPHTPCVFCEEEPDVVHPFVQEHHWILDYLFEYHVCFVVMSFHVNAPLPYKRRGSVPWNLGECVTKLFLIGHPVRGRIRWLLSIK